MKPEKIKEFIDLHLQKCEEFKSKWFEVECETTDSTILASFSVDYEHDNLKMKSVGFNHDDNYNTNKLSTYVLYKDQVMFVFETIYEGTNTKVYYVEPKQMCLLHNDYMMIGYHKQIRLCRDEDNYKVLEHDEFEISKDEYFNYTMNYSLPPYELYEYTKNLFDEIRYDNIQMYVSIAILEYLKNEV